MVKVIHRGTVVEQFKIIHLVSVECHT